MPVTGTSGANSNGIAFIVTVGAVWEAIAFACSSPQTAEINIRKRQHSLMYWVHMGQAAAATMVVIAATVDRKHRAAIIWGGLYGMGLAEWFYMHAKNRGLASGGPETEQY